MSVLSPRNPALLAVVLIAASATSTLATAKDAVLEEVIITAALMEKDRTHISATTLTAEDVSARGAAHFEDLLTQVPNMTASAGASRQRFFQIRGIGERSQFIEPINPSVVILQDGVDISSLGGALTTFDTKQIEVLRGPQGAIMGAGALAGLINIETTAPVAENDFNVAVGVENYGGHRLQLVANAAVNESLSIRVGHQRYNSDGWIENTHLDRDDTNNRDEETTRIALRYSTGADTIDARLTKLDIENGYDAFSLDNTRETLSDEPGKDNLDMAAALIRWNRVGRTYTSTLQLSDVVADSTYSYDEDWSFVGIRPDWEYSSFDAYDRDTDRRTLEWRITPSTTDTTDWVLGVYGRQETERLKRTWTYLDTPFFSRNKTDTLAFYGQVSHEIFRSVTVTSGVRFEERDTTYRDSAEVKENFNDRYWTGNISLDWQLTDNQSLYLTAAHGVRAGGINPSLSSTLLALADEIDVDAYRNSTRFGEERLINTELGWRFNHAEKRLKASVTLFNMDRRDQQVKGSLVIPREDGSTSFTDFTDNAASGTNRGVEATVDWQATDSLALSALFATLDATFDRYLNIDGSDLSGRDQPQAPTDQYRVSATYSFTTALAATLEVTGRDAFYLSDRHDVKSPSADLINANITWQQGDWSLTLWGRNLRDKTTITRGFGTFGNDPRKEYALEPYYQFGEPRTVGATINYRFGD